jgi:uncharacterized integral membrane protein
MKKINFLLLLLLVSISCQAQNGMEEYFFASGKIKVVIAIVVTVLVGLFFFLFALERRISKLEKNKKD